MRRSYPSKGRYSLRRKQRGRRAPLRRYRTKARRTGRRTRRNIKSSNSFKNRVLKTGRTNVWTNDVADVIRSSTTQSGSAIHLASLVTLNNPDHINIQSRLNQDELSDSSSKKAYYLSKAITSTTYTNSSANKVKVAIFYFIARNDYNYTPDQLLAAGFTSDGNILKNDPNSSPYLSPDFCTYNKLLRSKTRWLEQGESMTVITSARDKFINNDRYNNTTTIKGNMGHVLHATGNLGWDTTLLVPTTGQAELLRRTRTVISYKQLPDNQVKNFYAASMPNGAIADFRFANSDSGAAIAGTAGDVAP